MNRPLRRALAVRAPSLRSRFHDAASVDIAWSQARGLAGNATGRDPDMFPETPPWRVEDGLSPGFHPA